MKKNTLAKWMLAGSAMFVAFACQPKKTTDATPPTEQTKQDDSSSCGCTSARTRDTAPIAPSSTPSVSVTENSHLENSEDTSIYVIEIGEEADAPAEKVAESTPVYSNPATSPEGVSGSVSSVNQTKSAAPSTEDESSNDASQEPDETSSATEHPATNQLSSASQTTVDTTTDGTQDTQTKVKTTNVDTDSGTQTQTTTTTVDSPAADDDDM